MRYRRIPDETISRLPVYMRGLLRFSEQGIRYVSSKMLADQLGINSPQIRRDLSYFGGFGTRGVGYDVPKLLGTVRDILRLNRPNKAALVGLGNLGSALLKYPGFATYGMEITAIFDNDCRKTERTIRNIKVQDISKISTLKRDNISLAIIAVPASGAQEVADKLVAADIKGILNFAPCHIAVPKKVKVITIDIAMDLVRLPYYAPIKKVAKQQVRSSLVEIK